MSASQTPCFGECGACDPAGAPSSIGGRNEPRILIVMRTLKFVVAAAVLSVLPLATVAKEKEKAKDHKHSKECMACCETPAKCDACCKDKGKDCLKDCCKK